MEWDSEFIGGCSGEVGEEGDGAGVEWMGGEELEAPCGTSTLGTGSKDGVGEEIIGMEGTGGSRTLSVG
ncbi:unnamed protein product [Linum trigynum]|uniref:Uncharacterized protein n=1 Tax=Linum trigynum TaxID=586398 RepID=A0AAV2F2U6_9ROSI